MLSPYLQNSGRKESHSPFRILRYAVVMVVAGSLVIAQPSDKSESRKVDTSKNKKSESKSSSDASAGKGSAQDRTKSGHQITMDDKKDAARAPRDKATGQASGR